MAKLYACRSLRQNSPFANKNKFARTAPELALTNGRGTPIYTSAILHILILALALLPAFANLTARYFKKDLQQIFKTILEARAFAPTL